MADDFMNKIGKAKQKLNLNPRGEKADKEVETALSKLEATIKKQADSYVDDIKKFITSLEKKQKATKDKNALKAVEEVKKIAKADMEKRLANKSASTKPS